MLYISSRSVPFPGDAVVKYSRGTIYCKSIPYRYFFASIKVASTVFECGAVSSDRANTKGGREGSIYFECIHGFRVNHPSLCVFAKQVYLRRPSRDNCRQKLLFFIDASAVWSLQVFFSMHVFPVCLSIIFFFHTRKHSRKSTKLYSFFFLNARKWCLFQFKKTFLSKKIWNKT